MELLLKLLPAGALATCAGFRAFLPVFVITFLLRTHNLKIDRVNPFLKSWLFESEPVFVFLGVLTALEIFGDKLPSAANFLEIVLMFIRPAFGVLASFTLLTLREPNLNFILAVALGLAFTLPFQSLRSGVKILSDRGDFGTYNIVLSFASDILALGGILLAIGFPAIAIVLNPAVFYLTILGFRKWRVRLIAGQELDVDFKEESTGMGEFLEVKQLKKIGKKK